MKGKRFFVSLSVLVLASLIVSANRPKDNEAAGGRVLDFALKDATGRQVSLADFKDKKAVVVIFTGTECPVNNFYVLRLIELSQEFASRGVQFLAVNSLSQDAPEEVADHARSHKLTFPVLKDADQQVADLFRAERTPEVFVLTPPDPPLAKGGEWGVCYRGRIDDQYGVGYQRPKPNRRDLAEALEELLAGKPISKSRTEVAGCIIGRAKASRAASAPGDNTITYTHQVARILQKNCQECHRPGQIAPFALMTYEQTRGWADMIREVVVEGRMPPWHADPKYGQFSNNRRLPKEDRDTLLAWIDQACPKGDEKDLPPPKEWVEGWAIGKPDVILTMKTEYKVPAKAPKGGIPYKYVVVPTDFKEDMWVQAAEARPGNRAVVHHILVFMSNSSEVSTDDLFGSGFLVGVAPGDMPLILKPGFAKKVPKGAKLLLQLHYTPNGIEQTDLSSVGLIFAKEPPQHIVRTRPITQRRLDIPPGEPNHRVVSSSIFKKDSVLLSMMPHMHLRGKSFEYRAEYPDGRSEILLSVPRYDFGWQSTYRFAEPLRIPAGTKVVCTAHFDNSVDNPNNPDPTATVHWGDQTWEEMMIGWLNYYYVDEKPVPD